MQPDGRVLVTAFTEMGAVYLYRLRADGQPDTAFKLSRVPLRWVSRLVVTDRRIVAAGLKGQDGIFAAAMFVS